MLGGPSAFLPNLPEALSKPHQEPRGWASRWWAEETRSAEETLTAVQRVLIKTWATPGVCSD